MHYHGEFLSLDLAGFLQPYRQLYLYFSHSWHHINRHGIYRFSQTNAELYGGEAGVHFHPKTIPWLHIKGVYSSVTAKQKNGDYLPFIPAQKFRYEIRPKKKRWPSWNTLMYAVALTALKQNKPSLYETETDGYTLINAGIGTDIKLSNQLIILGYLSIIFSTQNITIIITLTSGILQSGA